jgi:hypothetical protein
VALRGSKSDYAANGGTYQLGCCTGQTGGPPAGSDFKGYDVVNLYLKKMAGSTWDSANGIVYAGSTVRGTNVSDGLSKTYLAVRRLCTVIAIRRQTKTAGPKMEACFRDLTGILFGGLATALHSINPPIGDLSKTQLLFPLNRSKPRRFSTILGVHIHKDACL